MATQSERIARELRRAIQAGDYAPSARLVERTLARRFAVSHIPVREALAQLAEEGLVERLPRRGARVAPLSGALLDEVSDIRVILERFVARRVRERLTPADEAELRRTVEAMAQAASAGDAVSVQQLDAAFHARLAELADHAILSELVAHLRGRVNAFLVAATAALEGEGLAAHAESHRRLLEAIVGGTAAEAQREAERHIRLAAHRMHRILDARATGSCPD